MLSLKIFPLCFTASLISVFSSLGFASSDCDSLVIQPHDGVFDSLLFTGPDATEVVKHFAQLISKDMSRDPSSMMKFGQIKLSYDKNGGTVDFSEASIKDIREFLEVVKERTSEIQKPITDSNRIFTVYRELGLYFDGYKGKMLGHALLASHRQKPFLTKESETEYGYGNVKLYLRDGKADTDYIVDLRHVTFQELREFIINVTGVQNGPILPAYRVNIVLFSDTHEFGFPAFERDERSR